MKHIHKGNPGGWCTVCHLHYNHEDHIKPSTEYQQLIVALENSANFLERHAETIRRRAQFLREESLLEEEAKHKDPTP